MTTALASTASITAYSLRLDFDADSVSAGEAITYTDPTTTINIAMAGDGNGAWRATITSAHRSETVQNQPIEVGQTITFTAFQGVTYSIQFTNVTGKRLASAIGVVITGLPDQ